MASQVLVDQEIWTNMQTALAHAVVHLGGEFRIQREVLAYPGGIELETYLDPATDQAIIRAKVVK
jgi:hypothetical protein